MAADNETHWLIAGLGNPGAEYERTRHNFGFMLVDKLAGDVGAEIKRAECKALVGRGVVEGETVEFVKPQTFMNLSGDALACLFGKSGRKIEKLIVVTDDLSLPLGRMRIRPRGSHGGHNGLRSIIDRLKTDEFIRLRLGIQPDHPVTNTRNFVLQRFGVGEMAVVEDVLKNGADAIRMIIRDGAEKAMALWNTPPPVVIDRA